MIDGSINVDLDADVSFGVGEGVSDQRCKGFVSQKASVGRDPL